MPDIKLSELNKEGSRVRLARGDFYVSRMGDQFLLTFEDTETHQKLNLGGIQIAEVDAMGHDLGSKLDTAQVTIHMHGASQCGEVEEGVEACCESPRDCQICVPMRHYWCMDWTKG